MPDHDEETSKERVNREMLELLNELRVALPGVQVLFAFLLTVPFSKRFSDASSFQHAAYFVALLAAAVASGLLIAPAAQHRMLFRQRDKEQLLRQSNQYAVAGMVVLAVAITSAILLVVDYLFGRPEALLTGGAVAVLLAWLWFVAPLLQRRRAPRDPG